MADAPKRTSRRWCQFRLSTWLVLVGIASLWIQSGQIYWDRVPARIYVPGGSPPPVSNFMGKYIEINGSGQVLDVYVLDRNSFDPMVKWAALATVAFLAWKGFWRMCGQRGPSHS